MCAAISSAQIEEVKPLKLKSSFPKELSLLERNLMPLSAKQAVASEKL
jgi:hypothetical protein